MIFPSLTTTIISIAAMAGVAIASNNLIINPMYLPCSPSSKHFCRPSADLRPRAYSQFAQIHKGALQASKVGTTATISYMTADLQA